MRPLKVIITHYIALIFYLQRILIWWHYLTKNGWKIIHVVKVKNQHSNPASLTKLLFIILLFNLKFDMWNNIRYSTWFTNFAVGSYFCLNNNVRVVLKMKKVALSS